MHKYRTHTCSEITKKNSGITVKLSGWIHRKRDHGNLLFLDLRDHHGLTQCVIQNDSSIFKKIESVRQESVITISGKVVKRTKETVNHDLPTGKIELIISQMNGKFLSSLKSNQLTNKNTKYNRVWNQCIYGLENILKKPESQIKYKLLSHHTKQLFYVGKLNLNKNI